MRRKRKEVIPEAISVAFLQPSPSQRISQPRLPTSSTFTVPNAHHTHHNASQDEQSSVKWVLVTRKRRKRRNPQINTVVTHPLHLRFIEKCCATKACFRCGGKNHFKSRCREPLLCISCGKFGHPFRHCSLIRNLHHPTPHKIPAFYTPYLNPNLSKLSSTNNSLSNTSTFSSHPKEKMPQSRSWPTSLSSHPRGPSEPASQHRGDTNTLPAQQGDNTPNLYWNQLPQLLSAHFSLFCQLQPCNRYLLNTALVSLDFGRPPPDFNRLFTHRLAQLYGGSSDDCSLRPSDVEEFLLICPTTHIRDNIIRISPFVIFFLRKGVGTLVPLIFINEEYRNYRGFGKKGLK